MLIHQFIGDGVKIDVGEIEQTNLPESLGGGVEGWFAYVLALIFLLFRPQGLFGEKIIERV